MTAANLTPLTISALTEALLNDGLNKDLRYVLPTSYHKFIFWRENENADEGSRSLIAKQIVKPKTHAYSINDVHSESEWSHYTKVLNDTNITSDLFPNLHTLRFEDRFNQEVTLPANLHNLHFGYWFNQEVQLPPNLHTLQFGKCFNQSITISKCLDIILLPESYSQTVTLHRSSFAKLEPYIGKRKLNYID